MIDPPGIQMVFGMPSCGIISISITRRSLVRNVTDLHSWFGQGQICYGNAGEGITRKNATDKAGKSG